MKRTAALDHSIARAALLPNATFSQPVPVYPTEWHPHRDCRAVGAQSLPVFIANNSVHEYTSQAVVNETLGLPH